ncbi:MAG TPA: FlgO family outer membrane protein [Polyangia bacterium]|jgi:TolB-like protein|nr:FlgO family outer membrane protein [Polyangia bacterium]
MAALLLAVSAALLAAAPPSPAAAAPPPLTVAVSYFDNNTGKAEYDPLAKGLADMLITDLGQLQALRIVEREKLNQVLAELKLSRSKFIDPKTAQRVGKGLAARFILSGGYTLAGDTIRIDARVFNVETGAVLTSERVEGKKDEFFALEKDIADVLIKALEVKLVSAERTKLRMNATQSWDAWSSYAAGLDAQDKGDVAAARAAYAKALAADPNYRAAKNATERLAVIFAQSAKQTETRFDASFRDLDPKAKDFAQRVTALLQSLDSTKSDQLARKVALLTWLGRKDLLACKVTAGPATGNPSIIVGGIPQGGVVSYCPQAQETLVIANRLLDDPTQWDAIPKVCEHFITRMPGDKSLVSYCEVVMGALEFKKKEGASSVAKELADDDAFVLKNTAAWDWRRALIVNRPAMRDLMQIYAGKGR